MMDEAFRQGGYAIGFAIFGVLVCLIRASFRDAEEARKSNTLQSQGVGAARSPKGEDSAP